MHENHLQDAVRIEDTALGLLRHNPSAPWASSRGLAGLN